VNSGERTYIVAKWIAIIGLTPLLFLFSTTLVGMFIGEIGYILVVLLFLILGYFLFQHKKSKPMEQVNDTFMFGVFLIFIGHIGLGAFYTLMIYAKVHGGGSVSGFFFIPMIFWMMLFYATGFSMVKKQKLVEELRKKKY